jgi:hypothetical protein
VIFWPFVIVYFTLVPPEEGGGPGTDAPVFAAEEIEDDRLRIHLLPSASTGGGAGGTYAQDALRIQRGENQPRVSDDRSGDGEAT